MKWSIMEGDKCKYCKGAVPDTTLYMHECPYFGGLCTNEEYIKHVLEEGEKALTCL